MYWNVTINNSLNHHDISETMTLVVNNSVAIWRHFCLHGHIHQRRLWERLFKRRFINGLTYSLTYLQKSSTEWQQNAVVLAGIHEKIPRLDPDSDTLKFNSPNITCTKVNTSENLTKNIHKFFSNRWRSRIKGAITFHQESSSGWRNDETRPLDEISALCFIQCFDTLDWMMGRTSSNQSINRMLFLSQPCGWIKWHTNMHTVPIYTKCIIYDFIRRYSNQVQWGWQSCRCCWCCPYKPLLLIFQRLSSGTSGGRNWRGTGQPVFTWKMALKTEMGG